MCDHCGCRAFPPIAELSREHDEILRLAWQAAEHPGPTVFEELLALLDRHVAKEEQSLYPLLHEQADLAVDRCVALESEHAELRAAVTQRTFDRRAFFSLGAHIEEEEMELFPAAMFAFDDEHWAEVAAVFAVIDMGPAVLGSS